MRTRTVRLESDDGRWLELRVEDSRALARVGEAEPFPFGFENFGYVANGMGYQAWGEGGHFAIRRAPGGVAVEFQGPDDRKPALCRLDAKRLRETLDALEISVPSEPRATLI